MVDMRDCYLRVNTDFVILLAIRFRFLPGNLCVPSRCRPEVLQQRGAPAALVRYFERFLELCPQIARCSSNLYVPRIAGSARAWFCKWGTMVLCWVASKGDLAFSVSSSHAGPK